MCVNGNAACSHTDLTSKQTPICCSYHVTYLQKDAHCVLFWAVMFVMNEHFLYCSAWSASVILEKRLWMKWCRSLAPMTEGVLQSSAFSSQIRLWINAEWRQLLQFRIDASEWLSFLHFAYFDSNSLSYKI